MTLGLRTILVLAAAAALVHGFAPCTQLCRTSSSPLPSLRRRQEGGKTIRLLALGAVAVDEQQPSVPRQQESRHWTSQLSRVAFSFTRFLAPIVLPVFFIFLVGVLPASARVKHALAGPAILAAAAATAATTGLSGPGSGDAGVVKRRKKNLLQKILEGVNADGSFLKEAGDTRSEIAGIINSFSSLAILGSLTFLAFLVQKRRDFKTDRAITRELEKIKEYKENMYFEAVQTILEKLADPKLKGSARANLQKQLKDLDPDGIIKKFVEEKGERPDISYLTDRKKKSKPKAADKFTNIAERKPPPKKSAPTTKKPSTRLKDEDNDDDNVDEVAANVDNNNNNNNNNKKGRSIEENQGLRDADEAVEPHLLVLNELFDSLEGVLPNKQRKFLVEYLKGKIDAVSDPVKRDSVVAKIAQKLGNDEYWVTYAESLQ